MKGGQSGSLLPFFKVQQRGKWAFKMEKVRAGQKLVRLSDGQQFFSLPSF